MSSPWILILSTKEQGIDKRAIKKNSILIESHLLRQNKEEIFQTYFQQLPIITANGILLGNPNKFGC